MSFPVRQFGKLLLVIYQKTRNFIFRAHIFELKIQSASCWIMEKGICKRYLNISKLKIYKLSSPFYRICEALSQIKITGVYYYVLACNLVFSHLHTLLFLQRLMLTKTLIIMSIISIICSLDLPLAKKLVLMSIIPIISSLDLPLLKQDSKP